MSYLRNNKALLLIIAALLVVNIGLLYYGFWKKERRHDARPSRPNDEQRMEMNKKKLKEEVGFTDEQANRYVDLRKKHVEEIRPMFDDLRTAKDSMFQVLYQHSIPDSVIAAYANRVCEKQKAIDTRMIQYFRSLKDLATNEQKPRMDSFIMDMTKRMAGPRPERGKKEKEKGKER